MAKPAYAIQCITNSSNRKNYNGRQGQKHAPDLHFIQPIVQHHERQYYREHGKQSGNWSDEGNILF